MCVELFLSFASPQISFTLVGIYEPCSQFYLQCLDQWLVYIRFSLNIGWIHDKCSFALCNFQKYMWPTYSYSSIWQPFYIWRSALHFPEISSCPLLCSFPICDIWHYPLRSNAWPCSLRFDLGSCLHLLIRLYKSAPGHSGYLLSQVRFDSGELYSLRFAQALVKGNQAPSVQTSVLPFGDSASVFEESPTFWDRALYSAQKLQFP